VKDPNGRAYNRTVHLDERWKMMQLCADYLEGLKAGAKVFAVHGKNDVKKYDGSNAVTPLLYTAS